MSARREDRRVKPAHQCVLDALAAYNLALGEFATYADVSASLSRASREKLLAEYARPIDMSVSKILQQLHARGLIFSPGRSLEVLYYGVPGRIDPESPLPSHRSTRQRVLVLVRMAVEHTGRPVRVAEVNGLLEQWCRGDRLPASLMEVSPVQVLQSMMSLHQTGDLVCVGALRGGPKYGGKLYLPADMDAEALQAPQPVPFMEQLVVVIENLWQERVAEAEAQGRRPRPLSTGEIRTRFAALHPGHERLRSPQMLVDGVQNLSRTTEPVLRAIRRPGQKALLWVPTSILDEAVDLGDAYTGDAERARTAVMRAEHALGRPVTLRDVQDEVDRDAALRPAGNQPLAQLLTDVAKVGAKERKTESVAHIRRAGTVRGKPYYTAGEIQPARAYVESLQAGADWHDLAFDSQVAEIECCALPAVAAGRLRLLSVEVNTLAWRISETLSSGSQALAIRPEVTDLAGQVATAALEVDRLLRSREGPASGLPTEVSSEVKGWTAEELRLTLVPYYPAAQEEMTAGKFAATLGWKMRRIPNPDFVSRSSGNHRTASTYLFDRADALLHAALSWGGTECRLHASLARSELGLLRDPRFLVPSLNDPDPERRLVAVACLAFLATGAECDALLRTAREDRDPGVRRSALWGYAFAGGDGVQQLVAERAERDPNRRVRLAAQAAAQDREDWWWRI